MVSTADPYENNWGHNSNQLNQSRSKTLRNTSIPRPSGQYNGAYNSKKTLDRFIERNNNKTPNSLDSKRSNNQPILKKQTGAQQTKYTTNGRIIKNNKNPPQPKNNLHSRTGTVRNNFTPLPNPQQQRNNTNRSNDPYGIDPLPSIRSPYFGGADRYPDLDSWGQPQGFSSYENNLYSTFDRNDSPFLPTYNLARKGKKGYIIAPKFQRPVIQDDIPKLDLNSNTFTIDNNDDDTKLDYIAPIPYTNTNITNPIVETQIESYNERTKQNIENVRGVIKTMDARDYDGKELFSTKFIEDLDYRMEDYQPPPKPKPARIQRRPTVQTTSYEPPARQFVRNTEADALIEKLKREAEMNVPTRNYSDEPIFNAVTLDFAEQIYNDEIEKIIKEIAANTINHEVNQTKAYEKPIYDKMYELTTNEMLRQVASEVLEEERTKVLAKDKTEIKKVAKDELVNNLMLDHMLDKMAQHGRASAENEDVGKILDGMIIDVLLNTNKSVHKIKEKTLANYPLKKFHLNSFMNVALDILVAELSTNLEEDMKDLEILEQNEEN